MKYSVLAIAAVVVILAAGCSTTVTAKDFSGLTTPDGMAAAHVNTTSIALNLLMDKPLWGDASLNKTMADCTREAKAQGATKVRIVQSSYQKYWWCGLPFSLIITPVVSNVACDALQ